MNVLYVFVNLWYDKKLSIGGDVQVLTSFLIVMGISKSVSASPEFDRFRNRCSKER